MATTTNAYKKRNITPYSGKWVAFVNNQVIESAPSLEELMKRVHRKRLKQQPSVMLVPRKDEGPYILLL